MVTLSQYQELAVSHANLSTRLQMLESEQARLKAELDAERAARAADKQAWANERVMMQHQINMLLNRMAGVEMPNNTMQTEPSHVAQLRDFLASRFTMPELEILVGDLGGAWGEMYDRDGGMVITAQRAVEWFRRRGRMQELNDRAHAERSGRGGAGA